MCTSRKKCQKRFYMLTSEELGNLFVRFLTSDVTNSLDAPVNIG